MVPRSIVPFVAAACVWWGGAYAAAPRLVYVPVKDVLDNRAVTGYLDGIHDALQKGALKHVILEIALQGGDLEQIERLHQEIESLDYFLL